MITTGVITTGTEVTPSWTFKAHLDFDTAPYVAKIAQAKKDWFHPDGMTEGLAAKMYWRCSHQWLAELNSTMVMDGPISAEENAEFESKWPGHYTFCGLRVCMDALLKGSVCELAMDAWQ